jgi:hypothetical protein
VNKYVVGVLVALGALWLLLALSGCAPESDRPTEPVITRACVRSFAPTLAAWQAQFGRVPDRCSTLDAETEVQLVSAAEMPPPPYCELPEDGEELAGCTVGDVIYLLDGRDELATVDTSVHEWVHRLAGCVLSSADRDHVNAKLWIEYGVEAVEAQVHFHGLTYGECL